MTLNIENIDFITHSSHIDELEKRDHKHNYLNYLKSTKCSGLVYIYRILRCMQVPLLSTSKAGAEQEFEHGVLDINYKQNKNHIISVAITLQ